MGLFLKITSTSILKLEIILIQNETDEKEGKNTGTLLNVTKLYNTGCPTHY